MDIVEALSKLTKEQWQLVAEVIKFHADPQGVEDLIKEIQSKNSWILEKDALGAGDDEWYLLANGKSFIVATSSSKQKLLDLAQHYQKEVEE